MNRTQRAKIAKETLEILQKGSYRNKKGQEVDFLMEQAAAQSGSLLYQPEDFPSLLLNSRAQLASIPDVPAKVKVKNQSSLGAARELSQNNTRKVLCLNFASAKNPGGGFLNGSQAQEESLARSSGIYPCLLQKPEMYEANKRYKSALYLDYMIYSPQVPVFRDDEDSLLADIDLISFITAPAVNAGVVRQREKDKRAQINPKMAERIEYVLAIALSQGYQYLILGAWGCGVFQNEPADIAQSFYQALFEKHTYAKYFKEIIFAILDHSKDKKFIGPFENLFTIN